MKKGVLFISFIFIAFLLAQPITADAATLVRPANNLGLVGYWSFDQGSGTVATDLSGNGNTGTLTNMAAPATATSGWGNGKLSGGLNFDGTNDYVTAGTGSTLSFESNSKFTISAWVNVSTNLSANGVIASKRTDSPATDWRGYELSVDGSTGKLFFAGMYVCCGGTTYMLLNGSTNLKDGKWHHVVLTFDGQAGGTYAGNVSLYVDGVAETKTVSSDNLKNGSILNSAPFMIGSKAGGAVTPFSGKIDEVRVYNRVLSSTQVISLYNTGAQKLKIGASNNGLVGYWSFNEGTSTKALDFSGYGNTGTLTNMSAPATATSGWGNGKLGGGLNFDGVNDLVDTGDNTALDFGSGDFTVSAWIYNTSQTNTDTIIGKDSSVGRQFIISMNANSAGGLSPGRISGSVFASNAPSYYGIGTAAGAVSPNQWHHIVYRRVSGVQSLWLDNVNMSVTPVTGGGGTPGLTVQSTVTSMQIGARSYTSFYDFFAGKIDEVRIYNRALSEAEIAGLYTSGAQKINASQNVTGSTLDSGLVGLWSFNGPDVNATTVFDRSGNGNNGTRTNGTTLDQGKVGQGLSFDGVDDYVDLGSTLTVPEAAPFSVSWWTKNTTNAGYYVGLRLKGSLGHEFLFAQGGTGLAGLSAYFGFRGSSDRSTASSAYNQAATLNKWVHRTVVFDGVNKNSPSSWSYYQDGVLVSLSNLGTIGGISSQNILGVNDGGVGYFTGAMDEVRLYNRALSATEVQLLYNLGK